MKIIKLVTEQDYGIREVMKLHKISHALVIYWLKAFRRRGGGRKITLYNPSNTKNSEAKDEKEKNLNPKNNRLF
ncbi:transposase [Haemophilus haemolyticus]|uniref:transposase n=1 Tax=Haemophilus haemolyticus TaxID=726 RepID=UPI001FC99242|nr:transposase [Haemophilus haemolyticus]